MVGVITHNEVGKIKNIFSGPQIKGPAHSASEQNIIIAEYAKIGWEQNRIG